jgi:23S rRNA-/tRNA-specific pseudouridylate synthase
MIGSSSRCLLNCRVTITQRSLCRSLQQSRRLAFTTFTKLPLPVVLFASNHVLAVYKPPGWHSIPHSRRSKDDITDENDDPFEGIDTSKCLLTHLQRCKLGGGSQQTYLKPLHRLDQPCSGVMLWGKTTKAASRLQRLFSPQSHNKALQPRSHSDDDSHQLHNHGMLKTYYVVVESQLPPPTNITNDSSDDSSQWTTVDTWCDIDVVIPTVAIVDNQITVPSLRGGRSRSYP